MELLIERHAANAEFRSRPLAVVLVSLQRLNDVLNFGHCAHLLQCAQGERGSDGLHVDDHVPGFRLLDGFRQVNKSNLRARA